MAGSGLLEYGASFIEIGLVLKYFLVTRIQDLFFRFREIILYGIIGGSCAALDFTLYTVLGLWIPYLWANIISVHAGIVCSFLLNRQYNFKVKDRPAKRFSFFYLIGLSGLGLSELLIYTLSERMGWDYIVSKFLTIVVVALYQFALNKSITFRKADNGEVIHRDAGL